MNPHPHPPRAPETPLVISMQTNLASRGISAFKSTRVAAHQPRSAIKMAALSQDELKKQAAWKAVEYVKSDMVLGTGSTAAFAVDRIGQLLKDGTLKNIIGVPTSIRTYEQAKALGIPLATLDEQPHINVAIDGADEVDPNLDVVKGRGGALLREKMVEMVRAPCERDKSCLEGNEAEGGEAREEEGTICIQYQNCNKMLCTCS